MIDLHFRSSVFRNRKLCVEGHVYDVIPFGSCDEHKLFTCIHNGGPAL